jgi:threonylcarbamoyladenosine tRNA methylthiotransferase MtaB
MSNEVVTFGCRLNIFESEVIKKQISLSNIDNAAIFNSCAVTSEAERQLRQSIRKYRKKHPDKKIFVTGCAAQINPDYYIALPEIDGVLGNQEKLSVESYNKLSNQIAKQILVDDILKLEETAAHMVTSFENKSRAFIEIQNGCNHRCTFCIIPFGRGNNRSVAIPEIISHCNKILAQGYQEIVLTGVDITDYGQNLPGTPSLGYLIKKILEFCPKLQRLRLSSLDVAEIDDDLRELIKNEPRLLSHFHLSLQSGDDMILKRMKRRHNSKQVYDFCDFVRKYRPDAAFGADIITGFPTETNEMFANTHKVIKDLAIPLLHIFPYSKRAGTPAAKIPQDKQVPKDISKERAKILRLQGQETLDGFMRKFIGKSVNALVEKNNVLKTDHFLKAYVVNNLASGETVKILIKDIKDNHLIGDIINE